MPYLYPSREGKAWEETTPRGDFNPASYAPIGVFAIASWATELADEQFDKLTPSTVEAVACALHGIVRDAQIQLLSTYAGREVRIITYAEDLGRAKKEAPHN